MPVREFANKKALIDYAEQNGLAYLWEGTRAFYKRQRLLSPDQYQTAGCACVPWCETVILLHRCGARADCIVEQ
jgi:hypothetical protein